MNRQRKGFTLIELLIVIGILGILAAVTVVVLNPAELLSQARDSSRISDLAAINSAIALYLSDVSSPSWTALANCTSGTQFPGAGPTTCTATVVTTVAGAGWVNVNFSAISTGSPLSRLPLDPNNGSTVCGASPNLCFYAYKSGSTTGQYELNANMESTRYRQSGGSDVESNTKDGGNVNDWYEVGSNLAL